MFRPIAQAAVALCRHHPQRKDLRGQGHTQRAQPVQQHRYEDLCQHHPPVARHHAKKLKTENAVRLTSAPQHLLQAGAEAGGRSGAVDR